MENKNQGNLAELTADIVSAFVSKNPIPPWELAKLILDVHHALHVAPSSAATPEPVAPAVPIKKSVHADYIVCLEDGAKFKSIKRHIQGAHGLTAAEYRIKWGLPSDYPMVSPNYAKARSELAKSMGLGRKRVAEAANRSRPARKRAAKPASAA